MWEKSRQVEVSKEAQRNFLPGLDHEILQTNIFDSADEPRLESAPLFYEYYCD